jgi:lysozyme
MVRDFTMSVKKKITVGVSAGSIALAAPLIAYWEGYSGKAYYDVVGIPTQCYGDTKHVEFDRIKSKEECQLLLREEILLYARAVTSAIHTPLGDNQKAAFTSWTYNVGIGAMQKSTLVRKANAGDLRGACNELLRWNKAGGVSWRGLTKRREAERDLCLQGL